jgi:hypothetical protein
LTAGRADSPETLEWIGNSAIDEVGSKIAIA